jgi:hypothetical protein
MSPRRLAHSHIHLWLIGGADDQRAPQHIVRLKWPGSMLHDALGYESRQGCGELGADHDHLRIGLKQSLRFPHGDLATADHQAAFTL